MTKKILNIEHKFKSGFDEIEMQKSLLMKWWSELVNKNMTFIPNARVSFKHYPLKEYPDQEEARQLIKKEYTNKHGEMYWCGELFTDFDALYNKLAEQKEIAELIIDEEQYVTNYSADDFEPMHFGLHGLED